MSEKDRRRDDEIIDTRPAPNRQEPKAADAPKKPEEPFRGYYDPPRSRCERARRDAFASRFIPLIGIIIFLSCILPWFTFSVNSVSVGHSAISMAVPEPTYPPAAQWTYCETTRVEPAVIDYSITVSNKEVNVYFQEETEVEINVEPYAELVSWQTYSGESVKGLSVTLDNSSINVYESYSGDVEVYWYASEGYNSQNMYMSISGGILEISERNRSELENNVSYVDIYLPHKSYKEFSIVTVYGQINMWY